MLCHICKKENPIMNIVGGGECEGTKIRVTLENGNELDKHSYNVATEKHCCIACKYCNLKDKYGHEIIHKKCLNCRDIDIEAPDHNFEASSIRA